MARRNKRKTRNVNKPDFHGFYAGLFGPRWPGLEAALHTRARQTAYSEGLRQPYYLDEASVEIARLLPTGRAQRDTGCYGNVHPRTVPRRILDMCAAPGGKALVIASRMPADAVLTANERSAARRARLHRVLDDHLPEDVRSRVHVTGHDATKWGLHEQNVYDSILLDVPCSSERHVINSGRHLRQWTPNRTNRLASQAVAMLAAGLTALAPDGVLIYATCALSPRENDDVVQRILDKWEPAVSVEPVELPFGEPASHGRQVLPDTADGRGPAYCARLRKLGS